LYAGEVEVIHKLLDLYSERIDDNVSLNSDFIKSSENPKNLRMEMLFYVKG